MEDLREFLKRLSLMSFRKLRDDLISLRNDYLIGNNVQNNLNLIISHVDEFVKVEEGHNDNGFAKEGFKKYIENYFRSLLKKYNINEGTIAEIGGHKNSFLNNFPEFKHKFISLFPMDDERYIVGDISNCPHIPSNSFNAIISISVLEHVKDINSAAKEIERLLKPGGVVLHVVPFSYFFHGAPVDYWRVSPTCMENLFSSLNKNESFFYSKNRRRNNIGSPSNPIDRDGGDQFKIDAFGGWRENWFTIYSGIKKTSKSLLNNELTIQLALNILKNYDEDSIPYEIALQKTLENLEKLNFDINGKVILSRSNLLLTKNELDKYWQTRSKKTYRPNIDRYNLKQIMKFYRIY